MVILGSNKAQRIYHGTKTKVLGHFRPHKHSMEPKNLLQVVKKELLFSKTACGCQDWPANSEKDVRGLSRSRNTPRVLGHSRQEVQPHS